MSDHASPNALYIVYDENCALCSSFIRLVDAIYSGSKLAVVVSGSGQALQSMGFIDEKTARHADSRRHATVIAIYKTSLLERSRAISRILRLSASSLARAAGILIILTPVCLADFLYYLVARHRLTFTWFFAPNCVLRLKNVIIIKNS
ncbi:MAG: DCC1-like thiol-disulfide oxidoreductase family protein [Steroidobacteraceae bacterium]